MAGLVLSRQLGSGAPVAAPAAAAPSASAPDAPAAGAAGEEAAADDCEDEPPPTSFTLAECESGAEAPAGEPEVPASTR